VGEGLREAVRFDLTFESDADIWDLHKVGSSQDFLPAGHIEQIGKMTGSISVGAQQYTIKTLGNRDHSLGPRDNKALSSHQWMQGYFANGISFLLFDAIKRHETQPVFSEAVVYEGDRLYGAKLELDWRCDNADRAEKLTGFTLTTDKAKHRIEATAFRGSSYLSFTSPNDLYVGVYQAGKPPLTLLEQSVALRLNGSIEGYGCFERTVPGVLAAED
jgi:hypothetical protein